MGGKDSVGEILFSMCVRLCMAPEKDSLKSLFTVVLVRSTDGSFSQHYITYP